ncbi:MAG: response regulator [Patescibacteria group bacterium]
MTDETDKRTVLLVEDDQTIRELYAMALIKAGFNIVMAENGEQGVVLALKHHPNLILLDIDMPIMDGHQAAKQIRNDGWGKAARIIFLTNHSDASNVAHAVMQKPEDFIVKAHTPVHDVINQVRIAVYGNSKTL